MRLYLVFILSLYGCLCAVAQDVISLTNGDIVKCKVEEISPSEIKYRDFSNLTGPLYVIPKQDVMSIMFENGKVEKINSNSNEAKKLVTDYPYPKTSKLYSIGDYFNEDGVEGIVFYTTDGGAHGLIIALNDPSEKGGGINDDGSKSDW